MMISREVVEQSALEIQQTQQDSEKQLREEQATRTGADPYRPWHPILNPEPIPERTFADYLREQEEDKKRRAELRRGYTATYRARLNGMSRDEWEQVCRTRDPELTLGLLVQMVLAKVFKSRTALASHLHKPSYYATALGHFLEREGFTTREEFNRSFSDRRGRSGVATRHTQEDQR